MSNKMIKVEIENSGWQKSKVTLEIVRNKSIRMISDNYNGKALDKSFSIGEMAEYDSYNLSYYGEIVGITEKSVTIQERWSTRKRRLKLDTFIWRNRDFDLAKKAAENAHTSMYI